MEGWRQEAAWLNEKKREELMERAKKLLTWIGLLMVNRPILIRSATKT
jgi:hypothetical protein